MILAMFEALAVACAVSYCFGTPLAAGLLLYPCAVIVILYGADFLGHLQVASYLLHAGSVLMSVSCLAAIWRSGTWRTYRQIQPRFAVVGMICLFALIQTALFCSIREFYFWDEFSHWGTVIRLIFEANTFHLSPNPLYFQDYPPGLALFAYHTLQLSGYSESNAYFSYAMLLSCFSASIVQLSIRGSLIGSLAAVLGIWASVDVLGPGWASVLIDHMLAFFFAGVLATYYLLRESGAKWLVLPLSLAAFSLTKQAALSFAMLASAIIAADWVCSLLHKGSSTWTVRFKKVLLPAVGLLVLMISAAVFASTTWTRYVAAAGLQTGWGTYSAGAHVDDFLHCCQSVREDAVSRKFFAAFFGANPTTEAANSIVGTAFDAARNGAWLGLLKGLFSTHWLTGPPGLAMVALSLASLSLIWFSTEAVDRWRNSMFAGLMILGSVSYSLSLLMAYLYAFSEYEALMLASFDRFFSVYLLAWLLGLIGASFATFNSFPARTMRQAHAVMAASIFMIFFSNITHARPVLSRQAYNIRYDAALRDYRLPARASIKKWIAEFGKSLPPQARIYILWPQTSGLEFWLAKHELLPRMTNLKCFGITPELKPKLVQECTMSEVQVRGALEQYDFVAVGAHLRDLQVAYPGIFAETNPAVERSIFRVVTQPKFQLVPLNG